MIDLAPELLACCPDATVLVDSKGLVRLANAGAAALFQTAAPRLTGLDFAMLVPALALGETRPGIDPVRTRARVRHAELFVEASVIAVSVAGERMFAVAFRRCPANAPSATSEVLGAVSIFASGAATALNDPLSGVLTNLHAAGELAEDAPSNARSAAELSAAIVDAREGAERVRAIIDDLSARWGARDAPPSALDARRTLESALAFLRGELQRRAKLSVSAAEVVIEANAASLGYVFLSLLDNAAQRVGTGRSAEQEIAVMLRRDGTSLVLEVEDTGAPCPAGLLGEMSESVARTFGATRAGLALSSCHQLVRALGGTIEVASERGRTIFRARLQGAQGTAPSRPASSPRARVLIIDDDETVAIAAMRALSAAHDAEAVSDPAVALGRLIAGERFDVILCDFMMPQMSGAEFQATLRREVPEMASRVVFLTGGASSAAARQFLTNQPQPVVDKPFVPATLRAIVGSFRK